MVMSRPRRPGQCIATAVSSNSSLEHDSISVRDQIVVAVSPEQGYPKTSQTTIKKAVKKVRDLWIGLDTADFNVFLFVRELLHNGIRRSMDKESRYPCVAEIFDPSQGELGELVMDAPVDLGSRTVWRSQDNDLFIGLFPCPCMGYVGKRRVEQGQRVDAFVQNVRFPYARNEVQALGLTG